MRVLMLSSIIAWLSLLFVSFPANAQVISEICPVSSDGYPYEWVEIYNNTESSLTTNTLQVTDEKDQQLTWQTGEISPHGYALATSSSTLNNAGDTVKLKNQDGTIISSQSYTGSFVTGSVYVSCNGAFMQSNAPSPLTSNEISCQQQSPTQAQNTTTQDYDSLVISEVMVDPVTNQQEWVELYNNNSFTAELHDWMIDDSKDAGATPFLFSITIGPKSYATVDITKTMFNNDGDTVRLLNAQGFEKDSITYTASENEKSIGRPNFGSALVCIQLPSRNVPNSSCIITEVYKTTTSPSSTPTFNPTNILGTAITAVQKSATNSSSEAQWATDESGFALPFFGKILGIKTPDKVVSKKPVDRKKLKLAESLAATSFMFSWANICYILFKIRKKYKLYEKQLLA